MKILLVQAYMGKKEPSVFPIALACIKSALHGHEVRAFDPNTAREPLSELKSIVEDFNPHAICISLRNIDSTNKRKVTFYYAYLHSLLEQARSCCDARVIVGGSGFSMFAAEIMRTEPLIDYGVYLEAEETLPELIDNLESPWNVLSVFYRDNGRVIFTGTRSPCDLDRLKMPDWKVLPLRRYGARDALGVETKRGCALGCIYCIYGFLNGTRYRLKSPPLVVDEIEVLINENGAQRFMFLDSVFNFPRAHAEAICRELIRRRVKAKWSAWFNDAGLDEQFLELLSLAGCDAVMLSPDALSDHTLKKLGKNMRRDEILAGLQLLRKCKGLDVSYNFFKNPPGQTLGNFLSVILFCIRAKLQLGSRVHFELNSLRIEPHTGLRDLALKEGVISEDDNLLYPRYYTNQRTRLLESAFNMLLILKGK